MTRTQKFLLRKQSKYTSKILMNRFLVLQLIIHSIKSLCRLDFRQNTGIAFPVRVFVAGYCVL